MKKIIAVVLLMACCALLTACGGSGKKVSYKDGTYKGVSSVYTNTDGSEDGNGYGEVEITIQDGKIADCKFLSYEPDGTLKDAEYGKEGGAIANRDFYNKAQKAVAACDEYASQLISNGTLDGIDAISGATINYNSFKEAVQEALSQAEAE